MQSFRASAYDDYLTCPVCKQKAGHPLYRPGANVSNAHEVGASEPAYH